MHLASRLPCVPSPPLSPPPTWSVLLLPRSGAGLVGQGRPLTGREDGHAPSELPSGRCLPSYPTPRREGCPRDDIETHTTSSRTDGPQGRATHRAQHDRSSP